MWKPTSNWLHRVSNSWVAACACTAFLLFSALVLPAQSRQAQTYAGGAGSPDTSLFYSSSDLYDTAEAYGRQGRVAYVRSRFTFDLIWPLVYTLFLTTGISWISARAFAPHTRWQLLNPVPILGAMFDYLENVTTSAVMMRHPNQAPLAATLAPAFTLLKWLLIGTSFTALFAGGVVGVWRWVRKPRA